MLRARSHKYSILREAKSGKRGPHATRSNKGAERKKRQKACDSPPRGIDLLPPLLDASMLSRFADKPNKVCKKEKHSSVTLCVNSADVRDEARSRLCGGRGACMRRRRRRTGRSRKTIRAWPVSDERSRREKRVCTRARRAVVRRDARRGENDGRNARRFTSSHFIGKYDVSKGDEEKK